MPTIDLTRNPREIPNFSPRKIEDSSSRYEMMRDLSRGWCTLIKDYNLDSCGLLSPRSFHSVELKRIIKQRSGEPYLIGIELECEGLYHNRGAVSALLLKYLPERHMCVTDGSLRQGGIEIVTTPLAPTEISRIQWYRLLKGLRKAGLWSFEDPNGESRCGLHVSISRNYLKEDSWIKLRRFLTRYQAYFKAISQRSDTYYCAFRNETTKYTALNLSKHAVAEFRFFRGNLSPKRHISAIETIRCLVETMRQCEDNAQNITPARYRRSLDRFPMAKRLHDEYSAIWETATARRAGGTGVRRPRRTHHEIAVRLIGTLRHSIVGPYDIIYDVDQRSITITPHYTIFNGSSVFYHNITGTIPASVNRDCVPACFDYQLHAGQLRSFPDRFMADLARSAGSNPITLVVKNIWSSIDPPQLKFYYRRGSFGRSSNCTLYFAFN